MKKRLVAPVFIPHGGCPHRCAYCDQWAVTAKTPAPPDEDTLREAVETYLSAARSPDAPRQVAFYGGTFTMLPVGEQERLLELARPYIESGRVHSLRLSTRPDAIEPGHLVWLKTRGVGTIELGAQSFDDRVLAAVQRGHTAAQTIEAARAVKDAGLELGLQLMCGLPGETRRSFTQSCRQAAMLRPSLVRIYPLLVLRGTALARDYEAGRFQPLSLGEAVSWCQEALALFEAAAIPVARMGLQSAPGLEASILAGPYHPAFGQLVRQALSGSKRHPKEVLSLNG